MDERNRLSDMDHLVQNNKDYKGAANMSDLLHSSISSHSMADVSRSVDAGMDSLVRAFADGKSDVNSSIRRLFQRYHQQQADLRSSDLQLNHVKLQVQALALTEQQLRQERDGLQYALAESEQDRMLLEARMLEIAGFEGGHGQMSHSLDDLRGQLLHIANDKMADLVQALNAQDGELRALRAGKEQDSLRLQNQALRAEVAHMGEQLAQRTVLYSAQERRLHDSSRTSSALQSEKDTELTQLRTRLQALERRYELVDRERIEAVYSERQGKEANSSLELELADAVERAQVLDAELSAVHTQNISLQAAVEHLRGANFDEIERDLAANVEHIRAEAEAREGQLKLQLENARELLSREGQRREAVLDEVSALRREVREKGQLLDALESQGSSQVGYAAPAATQRFQPLRSVQPEQEQSREGGGDSVGSYLDADAMDTSETTIVGAVGEAHEVDLSDDSIYAAMFADAEEEEDAPAGTHPFYRQRWVPSNLTLCHAALQALQVLLLELAPEEGAASTADDSSNDDDERGSGNALLDTLMAAAQEQEQAAEGGAGGAEGSSRTRALVERIQTMTKDTYAAATKANADISWPVLSRAVVGVLTTVATSRAQLEREVNQRLLDQSFLLSRTGEGACSTPSVSVSQSLSRGFLTGNADAEDSEDDHRQQQREQVEALLEELCCLKDELVRRKRKEKQLLSVLKTQEQKRAAKEEDVHEVQQSVRDSNSHSPLKAALLKQAHELECLSAEKRILHEKLAGYREEMECAQQQAASSRELGFHEGSEVHSARVLALEQQLRETQAQLSSALKAAAAVPVPAAAPVLVDTAVEAVAEVKDAGNMTDAAPAAATAAEAAPAVVVVDAAAMTDPIAAVVPVTVTVADPAAAEQAALLQAQLDVLQPLWEQLTGTHQRLVASAAAAEQGHATQVAEMATAHAEALAAAKAEQATAAGVYTKQMETLEQIYTEQVSSLQAQLAEAETRMVRASCSTDAEKDKLLQQVSRLHAQLSDTVERSSSLDTEKEKDREKLQEQFTRLVQSMQQDHTAELAQLTADLTAARHVPTASIAVGSDAPVDLAPAAPIAATKAAGSISISTSASAAKRDSAAQTSFSIGEAQMEQRVEFALAHQRLQEESKRQHELEMQKLALERQHSIDLHDKVAALHQEYETQLIMTRQKVSSKYRSLLEKQRLEFTALKNHLVEAIKKEQEDATLQEGRRPAPSEDSFMDGLAFVGTGRKAAQSVGAGDVLVAAKIHNTSLDSDSSAWKSARSSYEGSQTSQPSSPTRSSASRASQDLEDREGSVDINDVSRESESVANTSATLSPPRWRPEDASLSSMMQTPVQVQGGGGGGNAASRGAPASAPARPAAGRSGRSMGSGGSSASGTKSRKLKESGASPISAGQKVRVAPSGGGEPRLSQAALSRLSAEKTKAGGGKAGVRRFPGIARFT